MFTVCEYWPICECFLPNGKRGWKRMVSGCAMACRVAKAVIPRTCHLQEPAVQLMLRGQSRRTEVLSVLFIGSLALTGSGLSLRSLLRWSPDPDQRVGNAVSFKSRYCTSAESKPLGNGDAVLLSRTPVRRIRTHVSNRFISGSTCSNSPRLAPP